ncbi:hypothetical protein pneo_cds_912 [Pandoravirus neocaledonia]|uniref:Uncharacterized protein n=1 Tax=Pandoravirus neocaledonia TaxID=2107708 RepID=A0A2U7UDH6_9VIRU|nr:hypothetical protein pneo_cds_912 [Pandoravirus neocaledonia]AVK76519.1 hypothetical protein pneo_cds_912 [Pandoravirus neocaledonia]
MAAIMLDRINALSHADDLADARFDCGTRHVSIGGRLFINVDHALADVLRDVALGACTRIESRGDGGDKDSDEHHDHNHCDDDDGGGDGGGDNVSSPQLRSAVVNAPGGDNGTDRIDTAWWIYRSRVAQRLCGAASAGDAIERDHPLDVTVHLCGVVSDLRRAAHERAVCYSPAGLLRLFDRMRARWVDCALGLRLAHLARPDGPVQRAAVRAALGSARRVSLSGRRRRRAVGAHDRPSQIAPTVKSPETATATTTTAAATTTPEARATTTAQPWPVEHMSLDFMYRLQRVINRPVATMVPTRDAPLSPPLADMADDVWRGFA